MTFPGLEQMLDCSNALWAIQPSCYSPANASFCGRQGKAESAMGMNQGGNQVRLRDTKFARLPCPMQLT